MIRYHLRKCVPIIFFALVQILIFCGIYGDKLHAEKIVMYNSLCENCFKWNEISSNTCTSCGTRLETGLYQAKKAKKKKIKSKEVDRNNKKELYDKLIAPLSEVEKEIAKRANYFPNRQEVIFYETLSSLRRRMLYYYGFENIDPFPTPFPSDQN